jgi:hypothetical protein
MYNIIYTINFFLSSIEFNYTLNHKHTTLSSLFLSFILVFNLNYLPLRDLTYKIDVDIFLIFFSLKFVFLS